MSYLFSDAITYKDSPSLDSFSRLRVSSPLVLFDSKQIFSDQTTIFWDQLIDGATGLFVYDSNRASTVMSVVEGATGFYTRQTKQAFNYQPGKSMLILLTGIIAKSGNCTNTQRRIGYFDDNNGLFFEYDNDTCYIVRRTSTSGTPVDDRISQSNWNLDPMDGSGLSGITIDWGLTQILVIDFEWLGVGRVRFGVNIDGKFYYVHEFKNANNLDAVYMSTPNLPCTYQIQADNAGSGATGASMEAICTTVASEGGQEELGTLFSKSTGSAHIITTTEDVTYGIIGIRLKEDRKGADINLISASVLETSPVQNNPAPGYEWHVIFNPVWTGATGLIYADIANSSCQVGIANTGNPSTSTINLAESTVTYTGIFASANKQGSASSASLQNAIKLGIDLSGVRDEFVVAITPRDGVGGDIHGAINWRESP